LIWKDALYREAARAENVSRKFFVNSLSGDALFNGRCRKRQEAAPGREPPVTHPQRLARPAITLAPERAIAANRMG